MTESVWVRARHGGRVLADSHCGWRGDFYGGWITTGIVGPFKGEPGTGGW